MTTTLNTHLDGAIAALEQVISEEQRGIGTYRNQPIAFPRFRAPRTYSILQTMCGFSATEAKKAVRDLVESKHLVRSGESTATEYTTAAVHDAEINQRVEHRHRADVVIDKLVELGVYAERPEPTTYVLTYSDGASKVRVYQTDQVSGFGSPVVLGWQAVEVLLKRTGHLK